MRKKNGALLLNEQLVSIDTIWDLKLAEFLRKTSDEPTVSHMDKARLNPSTVQSLKKQISS